MIKNRPTIRDVAKKAGLSVSTVSLVVNGKSHVGKGTRQKVEAIIRELGYHPHRSARGLASKASGNIGFILTDDHFSHSEPFYTKVFLGTEVEARKHNYYILLTTVGKTVKETREIPRFLLEDDVDGVIIAGKIGSSWVEYVRELGIPLILIDYEFPRPQVSSVMMDNRTGSRLAVQHLLKGGHRSIGFIAGDLEHPSMRERYDGFLEALKAARVSPVESSISVDEPDTRPANGYEAARKIFPRDGGPTAVFAANDALAIGCMLYLRDLGKRIPADVGIVGFDNVEAALHVEPRLTTVNVHREEMGALAVRRLVEMIKDKSSAVTRTLTQVELIVRESCGITDPIRAKQEKLVTV